MADIFVPAYLKKTEYCDKGDKWENLVDCDKGDHLKFKCDSFYKKFKKTNCLIIILVIRRSKIRRFRRSG